MINTRCPFCFSVYNSAQDSTCPSCGKSLTNNNPEFALPFGFCIQEHVVIGRYLKRDCEAFEYEGLLNAGESLKKVHVREFFPRLDGVKRGDDQQVFPEEGSEVVFKTSLMDFIDLYRILSGMKEQPGLLEVYDCFEASGTAYAVTEAVKGIPLENYLAGSKKHVRMKEALKILTPIARGISEMHCLGVPHLGISADTILITPEGNAKLGSYGTLALRAKGVVSHPELLDGYSAPEQYSSDQFCDQISDIYSLAAVFYRALTGKKPQSAQQRIASDRLEPISTLNNSVPVYFSAAIGRALRIVPSERFASMDSFLEVIGSLEMQPSHTPETSNKKQPTREHLQNDYRFYWLMGILAVIAVMLCVLCMIFLSNNSRKPEPESASEDSSSSELLLERAVPDVVGQNYKDLASQYPDFSFVVLSQEYNSQYEAGIVISQTPSAGLPAYENSQIGITVSLGPELVKMPNILGFTKENAIAELNARGIRFSLLVRENNGEYVSGCVAETDVLADTTFDPNQVIVNVFIAGDRDIEIIGDESEEQADSD